MDNEELKIKANAWLEKAKATTSNLVDIGYCVCGKNSVVGVFAAGCFFIVASVIYAACMPIIAVRRLLKSAERNHEEFPPHNVRKE